MSGTFCCALAVANHVSSMCPYSVISLMCFTCTVCTHVLRVCSCMYSVSTCVSRGVVVRIVVLCILTSLESVSGNNRAMAAPYM